ncbi:MAG: hypothetical protein JXR48_18650 [Candidatus Delongbacteria bacterium]|nr:hypothetical protein [Candidatus Delongbacteria bacterium]MBN2836979.1 hypothetical protein [Candidatus Delongbacteria bacterium]
MKLNVKKYLGECFLIVFSVLFALFINKAFDNYQMAKQAEIAKDSIKKELIQNQVIINQWLERHIEISNRISYMIENPNDSLKTELKKYNYLNFAVLTNDSKSIVGDLPSNTAWESAKTTGIISEFEYEIIKRLTKVYDIQSILINKTLMSLLDSFYDNDTHNIDKLDNTLTQFQLRFWDLTGQERSVIFLYNEALKEFERE